LIFTVNGFGAGRARPSPEGDESVNDRAARGVVHRSFTLSLPPADSYDEGRF